MDEPLANAQKCLKIEGVNLTESRVFVRDSVDLGTIELESTENQSFRTVLKIREALVEVKSRELYEYRFTYSAGMRLIFSSEEEESVNDDYQPIIEIVGVFSATYISKIQVDKKCLEAFAEDNVGYHVWPYWREYVQSTCSRIGFYPAFNVPFYLLPQHGDVRKNQGDEVDCEDGGQQEDADSKP